MSRTPQLWATASSDLKLTFFSGLKGKIECPKMRALYWPNGRVCWEVNIYLISLRKRRREVSTINTYCAELSVFVRFVGSRSINFSDVDDDVLVEFSSHLVAQGGRSGAQINRLLARAIRFLWWLQERMPYGKLVGYDGDGAAVTVEKVRLKQGARGFSAEGIRHHSFVPPSVRRIVRPMATSVIQRLFAACGESGHRSFIRARNYAILKLLEGSGIRREELVFVRVDSIRDALRDRNLLLVRSSKQKGNPDRLVPVPTVTLKALVAYLDVQRAMHVAGLERRGIVDEGWAFCSQTGSRLAAATVTQIFADWRKTGEIRERAHPHMLRHRWITKQLTEMLRSVGSNVPLSRELIVTLLTRLASKTGHTSIESMFGYIDFAYIELGLSEQKVKEENAALGWQYGMATLGKLIEGAESNGRSADADLFRSLLAVFEACAPQIVAELSVAAHSVRGA